MSNVILNAATKITKKIPTITKKLFTWRLFWHSFINRIRRISRVKKLERRSMKDIIVEVGTKARIVWKRFMSRIKWAGHMVRMKVERLPKWSETKKQGLRKAEEGEKSREKANNRDQWKNNNSSRTCIWLTNDRPLPYKRETRGRTIYRGKQVKVFL